MSCGFCFNIEQTNNYYPYGGLMASSSTIYSPSSSTAVNQPNRYNGKELDRKNALDWHDYDARYFAGHGQWTSIDPLAEKYYDWSPYVYCIGNPIKFIDPDGRDVWIRYVDDYGQNRLFHFNGKQGIRSNNAFVNDFLTAYYYLEQPGAGEEVRKAVTDNNYVIVLQQSSTSRFDWGDREKTVFWNPRQGIKTTGGGRQSPATILEHEFAHAVDESDNPAKHHQRKSQKVKRYDNLEEKRVIRGAEAKTARKLGEAVRTDHRGTNYKIVSPTSTKEYGNSKKKRKYSKP